MKRHKIVVIEDEADLREVLRYALDREGFLVRCAADGNAGLELVRREAPDVVLLDLMLPGLDGHEVCRRIRSDALIRSTPIIMLTAKDEEADVVVGLGLGADDYITKPFRPRELVARVKAVLRRVHPPDGPEAGARIVHDGLVVDSSRHEVRLDGVPIRLTATEFRLLHLLAGHPGRVYTRDHLVGRVIGESATVIDRNIDVHVRSVRRKLGAHRDLIETVRGVGYRFRAADRAEA